MESLSLEQEFPPHFSTHSIHVSKEKIKSFLEKISNSWPYNFK